MNQQIARVICANNKIYVKTNMADKKKAGSVNWSERDKIILVQNVFNQEDKVEGCLFGKFKGTGRDIKVRNDAWEEVSRSCNAEFEVPRLTSQIQKQFDNLKAKGRAFLDERKNPKTGGGPCAAPPLSIELILSRFGDKPNMMGLVTGVDTEEQNTQATCSHDTVGEDHSVMKQSSWLPLFGVPKLTVTVYNSTNNSEPAVTVLTPSVTTETSSCSETTTSCTLAASTAAALTIQSEDHTKTADEASQSLSKKRKKNRQGTSSWAEDDWLCVEKERAKMDIEKIKKEIELCEMRSRHEAELFALKKEVLKAKLKYFSSK